MNSHEKTHCHALAALAAGPRLSRRWSVPLGERGVDGARGASRKEVGITGLEEISGVI